MKPLHASMASFVQQKVYGSQIKTNRINICCLCNESSKGLPLFLMHWSLACDFYQMMMFSLSWLCDVSLVLSLLSGLSVCAVFLSPLLCCAFSLCVCPFLLSLCCYDDACPLQPTRLCLDAPWIHYHASAFQTENKKKI